SSGTVRKKAVGQTACFLTTFRGISLIQVRKMTQRKNRNSRCLVLTPTRCQQKELRVSQKAACFFTAPQQPPKSGKPRHLSIISRTILSSTHYLMHPMSSSQPQSSKPTRLRLTSARLSPRKIDSGGARKDQPIGKQDF